MAIMIYTTKTLPNSPLKLSAGADARENLSNDELRFGNRFMVHALIKFDTEQVLAYLMHFKI